MITPARQPLLLTILHLNAPHTPHQNHQHTHIHNTHNPHTHTPQARAPTPRATETHQPHTPTTSTPTNFKGFGEQAEGFATWQVEEARQAAIDEKAHVAQKRRRVLRGWADFVQGVASPEADQAAPAPAEPLLAQVRNVSVLAPNRTLLSPQSWAVHSGQRVGVLGESGCGKSLQLRLLAGLERPSSGEVWRKPDLRIEYVPQDAVRELRGCRQTVREYTEERVGSDALARLHELLPACLLPALDTPLAALSCGQLVRVAVSVATARAPALLLLDEPTNHLDLEGIEWLEALLLGSDAEAIVIVSHDREVLERVTTHTLSSAGGGGSMYAGGYCDYVRRLALQQETLEQIRSDGGRPPAPDGLPQRLRPSRFHLQTTVTPRAREAVRQPQASPALLAVKGLEVRFEDINSDHGGGGGSSRSSSSGDGDGLTNVDLTVGRGEVVLLLGANGAGKSTLLRACLGLHPSRAGSVELGEGARLFYFSQEAATELSGEQTAWYYLRGSAEGDMDESAGRRVLRQMGLPRDSQAKPLRALSGGERARLVIARMLLSRANLLLLDEPTNHLDVLARSLLEEALRTFDGGILLISHDRFLTARVATRVVELRDSGVTDTGLDYRALVARRDKLRDRLASRQLESVLEGEARSALDSIAEGTHTAASRRGKRRRRADPRSVY